MLKKGRQGDESMDETIGLAPNAPMLATFEAKACDGASRDALSAATKVFQKYVQQRFTSPSGHRRDKERSSLLPERGTAYWNYFIVSFVALALAIGLAIVSAKYHLSGPAFGAGLVVGCILVLYAAGMVANAAWLIRPGAMKRAAVTWVDFDRDECDADLCLLRDLHSFSREQLEEIELWLERWAEELGWRLGPALKAMWIVGSTVFAGLVGAVALKVLPQLSMPNAIAVGAFCGIGILAVLAAVRQFRMVLHDALVVTRLVLKRKTKLES
jgi:hypothetical protein